MAKHSGLLTYAAIGIIMILILPAFADIQKWIDNRGTIKPPGQGPSEPPKPPSTANLAPLATWHAPDRWSPCYWDTTTTHNGNPSWRNVGSDPYETREMNSYWIAVKPGDHVVLSAWIKTDPSDIGTTSAICPQSGARIGFDFYGGDGLLYWNSVNSAGLAWNPHGAVASLPPSDSVVVANFVGWGTSTWAFREIDAVVPSLCVGGGGRNGGVPSGVVLWFGVMTNKVYGDYRWQNEDAPAWLSETKFYINP